MSAFESRLVTLHVYDLHSANSFLSRVGFGMYHTGVEVSSRHSVSPATTHFYTLNCTRHMLAANPYLRPATIVHARCSLCNEQRTQGAGDRTCVHGSSNSHALACPVVCALHWQIAGKEYTFSMDGVFHHPPKAAGAPSKCITS
jgi:hypothetical protein